MRRIPDTSKHRSPYLESGFTLIELIVVITIVAIIAATANQFIANPTRAYLDIEARANLTDRADGALRIMARKIRNALPNSVRITNNTNSFIEFIPIKDAGRYRSSIGSGGSDNPLDFTLTADTFDVLGPAVTVESGDELVIYNLGDSGSNAYETPSTDTNRRQLDTTGNLNTLSFTGGKFSWQSPGKRFYIVATPVTYACDMTTDVNNKKLIMYSNYAISPTQPATIATLDGLSNVRKSTLAENLSSCQFQYDSGVSERTAVVNIALGMTQNGANVRLMHQVNVVNTP